MLKDIVEYNENNIQQSINNLEKIVKRFENEGYITLSEFYKELERKMEVARKIADTALALRQENGLRRRWPCKSVIIVCEEGNPVKGLEGVIATAVNVRQVLHMEKKPEKGKFAVKEFGSVKVFLDVEETPEIKFERFISDLARHIQFARKKHRYKVTDQIVLYLIPGNDQTRKCLEIYAEKLARKVGAKEVILVEEKPCKETLVKTAVSYRELSATALFKKAT